MHLGHLLFTLHVCMRRVYCTALDNICQRYEHAPKRHTLCIMCAGKRPQRSLAAYGAYLRSIPSANEQGLRMLIGAAVREGAARGVSLTPMFSLYSYHGPVSQLNFLVPRLWTPSLGSGRVPVYYHCGPWAAARWMHPLWHIKGPCFVI